MSRSTYTLFIGVFSVALYLMMTIFTGLFTLFVEAVAEVVEEDEDISEETKEVATGLSVIFGLLGYFMLFYYFIMLIFSMFLIYGVQKERHTWVAPWVIMTAIGVIIQLVNLGFEVEGEQDQSSFFNVLACVISAAFWYPVYSYYKDLKHPKCVKACPTSPAAGYVASEFSHVNAKYVPTSVCKV